MQTITSPQEPSLDLTLHHAAYMVLDRVAQRTQEDPAVKNDLTLEGASAHALEEDDDAGTDDEEDLQQELTPRRNNRFSGTTAIPEIDGTNKRSIRFYDRVTIMEIASRFTYTAVEKASMWYSAKEMDQLFDERPSDVIARMEQENKRGRHLHDSMSTYGLRTKKEVKECNRVVGEALQIVLLEQEMQWEEGVADPEHMADMYFDSTRENQREALERGRRLARELLEDDTPRRIDSETECDYDEKLEAIEAMMEEEDDEASIDLETAFSNALNVFKDVEKKKGAKAPKSKPSKKKTDKKKKDKKKHTPPVEQSSDSKKKVSPDGVHHHHHHHRCKSDSMIDNSSLDLTKARSLFSAHGSAPPSFLIALQGTLRKKAPVGASPLITSGKRVSKQHSQKSAIQEVMDIVNSSSKEDFNEEDDDVDSNCSDLLTMEQGSSSMNSKWDDSCTFAPKKGGDFAPSAPPRKASLNCSSQWIKYQPTASSA